MDLVTANVAGNNVSILLGSGTGTFAPAVNYAVGSGPQAVCSADFNGDGKMDVASVNTSGNTVSILLGSGTGTFAPAVNYAAGSSSNAIFSADFNGDGKMDLVTANYGSNSVSVLLGSGTGTFAAAVNYSCGLGPQGVFSADFNGDGKMDLVTANFDSNNISILLGSGTGTFAAAVNYAVVANPEAVFSADFNGDGKKDLAVANLGSNKVSVLLGNGTGTFAAAVNYTVGLGPISVFSADFNGDGKMDLATCNQNDANVSVLLGSGSGTFSAPINYPISGNPMCIFSADFNGDGKMDLSVANQSTTVSILLNTTTFPTGATLNFDGTNDFVNIPNNSSFSFGTNDFTIETYAKTTSTSGVQVMLGKYDASNNYWLGVNNGKVTFSMIGGGNVNGAISIADNNWHHIAVVRQSGVVSLYIDGALDASGTNAGTATISGNLTLGNFNGGYNFPGSLDEVRLWNRALCKGEILNNKNAELPASQTGLVAYYKFNQGFSGINNSTVTTLTDLSVNANNGTLNFFALSGTTSNWVAPGAVTSGSTATTYTAVSASVSSQVNVLCNGGNTGSATVTTTGGTSPYTYLASTGATVSTLSNLTAGAYTYTVTDANGCKAIQTLTITQPSALVTNTVVSNVLCNGGSTGAINLTVIGGASGYTFMWNDGVTTEDRTGLVAGVKTVTVTDANACTKIQSATITEPTAISTSTAITNVLCNGGNTGSATVTTTGGTSPYTYLASTGATVSTLPNLTAGAYTYTVTDNNGCAKTQALTITEPSILGTALGIWPISCNGSNNGQLIISGTQGTAPYTYAWNTGATTSTITNLPPGVYTATVTDANGCVAIRTKTITEQPPITVTITASNSSICSGSSSTLTASASGGLMGSIYTYSWVAGPTTSVSVVSPTSTTVYTVNVTDDNSCVQTATVSVTTNVCTSAEALNFDGVNDYVDIPNNNSFNFGTNDFTIETWAKTTSTSGTKVMIGRLAGINDFWLGVSNNKITFSLIGGPDINSTTNFADGNWHHIAVVRNTGVVSLYINGVLEGSQTNAGTMTINGNLTIGNFNGGYYFPGSMDEVRIWNNARTQCEINTYKNCEIPTNATGLVANYHFNQGNAAVNNTGLTSLTDATSNNIAGSLTYFALNGATSNWVAPGGVVSGYTTPATAPTITVNSGSLCSGQSFTISPTGANSYTIQGGSTVVTPTANTNYTVVGQTSGCISNVVTSSVTVNSLPSISVNSGAMCTGQSFTMTPMGADTYTFSSGSDVVMPTADATYTVTGTVAATGCSNTAVSSVTVNPLPIIVSNPGNMHICGDVAATFGVSSPGTNTYQWYFEYTQLPNDSDLIDGSYTEINYDTDTMTIQQVLTGNYNNYYVYCEVTNQYGCKAYSANDTIWANPSPTVTVNSGTICAGQSFTMIPNGASTYSYSNGSNVAMPTVDATYTVTGTDANGCKNTAVSTITVNALPGIMATTNNTLLCTGETATLSVMGASTYTWSTTENTINIAVSPTIQTTYTVNGTDANGCSNTTTITQDVSLCTGVASLTNDASVNVYPNPNKGAFVVELTSLSKVTVMNALGQVIMAETYEAGKHTVNINNESPGVYFVKVVANNRQQIIKIIKEQSQNKPK